ncbi:MAG: hypothetical protein KA084_01080 [Brachymonas sp.]|nr:hypothetical protein [Brachymonas sp.]
MAQSDQKTFLGKLARFVTNPTTNWAALDGGQAHPDLHTAKPAAAAAKGETGALSQSELLQIQRQRRKRNRSIREKEFAMLRQIRAGARIEGLQTYLDSVPPSGVALPAPSLTTPATQKNANIADKFDVNRIDKVEQQMTKQWWAHEKDNPAAIPDLKQASSDDADANTPKTQIMFDDAPALAFTPAQSDQFDEIVFDTVLFAKPAQPNQASASASASAALAVEQDTQPEQSVQAGDLQQGELQQGEFRPMRDSAYANGTGESVDLPDAQQAGDLPFTYENPPTQLHADFQAQPASEKQAVAAQEDNRRQVPLSAEDEHLMAETQELDAAIQQINQHGIEAAAYTPGSVENLPEGLNEPAILFAQKRDDEARAQLRLVVNASIALAKQKYKSEPDALLALLDLYRASRQEDEFENASIELVQYFERSAPQYRAADRVQATRILSSFGSHHAVSENEQSSWCAPAKLGLNDVMLLRSQMVVQKPKQVLLDWRPLQTILDDALEPLLDQLHDLIGSRVEVLMWGAEHFMECCERQLQGASRSAGVLLWLLRLEMVRLMYGKAKFEALSLKYCVAMEQSPPPWEPVRCQFFNADSVVSLLMDEDSDMDSPHAGAGSNSTHPFQWQGEMAGSIQPVLRAIEAQNTGGPCVIDCLQLDRMDYSASAELLNWLINQSESAQREVRFIHVHRLLAVFWRILGITAKAQVDLRLD